MPDNPIPNVYTLPLAEILVGVLLDKDANPPLIENAKSLASKEPLELELYTGSLMVTAKVLLSDANDTDNIVGSVLSIDD